MVEEVGRGSDTKGEVKINVEFTLPVDAKKLVVLQANWAKAECVLNNISSLIIRAFCPQHATRVRTSSKEA